MESLLAFAAAFADACLTPKVEGQSRKLRAGADTVALMLTALGLIAMVAVSLWLLYRSSVIEEKVDRAVSGVERIETALIGRAVAQATPKATPMRAHVVDLFVQPAAAEGQ